MKWMQYVAKMHFLRNGTVRIPASCHPQESTGDAALYSLECAVIINTELDIAWDLNACTAVTLH